MPASTFPNISVIIPCYNAEEYVRDAIASVLAQTYQPLEVICVDDGSTDGTLGVLRSLEAEHSDIMRVLAGPNGGAPVARNRGLAAARGDYIQYLDTDDLLVPEKLAHQAGLIRETEE